MFPDSSGLSHLSLWRQHRVSANMLVPTRGPVSTHTHCSLSFGCSRLPMPSWRVLCFKNQSKVQQMCWRPHKLLSCTSQPSVPERKHSPWRTSFVIKRQGYCGGKSFLLLTRATCWPFYSLFYVSLIPIDVGDDCWSNTTPASESAWHSPLPSLW